MISPLTKSTRPQSGSCTGEFTEQSDNVVLIGGPGIGKTHLATDLGIQPIEHGRRKVQFFSTADLVNALEQKKTTNKADRLLRLGLVVLSYLPFSSSGGTDVLGSCYIH